MTENAMTRLQKVMAEENGEKYYSQEINKKRNGVRCNDHYKAVLNNMKRIYYKEFYRKGERHMYKWNRFANETGLYYSLEKIFEHIDPNNFELMRKILADPYIIKYIWD